MPAWPQADDLSSEEYMAPLGAHLLDGLLLSPNDGDSTKIVGECVRSHHVDW